MRLDDRKDIKSVKSVWSILHSELKALVLPPLEREIEHGFLRGPSYLLKFRSSLGKVSLDPPLNIGTPLKSEFCKPPPPCTSSPQRLELEALLK